MNNKNKKVFQKITINVSKKGFTLVETLVSMFIFLLMMLLLSGSFSNFLKEFATSKKEQKMLENSQYTLSLMEKTIRTSVVSTASGTNYLNFDGVDGKKIKLFDNSQSKCLAYVFDQINKKIVLLSKDGNNIDDCDDFSSGYSLSDLTANNILDVSVEGWVSSPGVPGRISVALTIKDPNHANKINIGMTASLRSFDETTP